MTSYPIDQALLKRAIKRYGKASQWAMAYGECGEFVALSGRTAQGRATNEDRVSECADVLIMMTQVAIMIGMDKVTEAIQAKQARLSQKLDEDEPEQASAWESLNEHF